jgi:murein L,D-transpeptidase YcbB/YkuD
MTFTPAEAGAQNLFDLLFGGPRVYRDQDYYGRGREYPPRRDDRSGRNYRQPKQPQARSAPRVSTPKISAPSYYTYKADALVRVDFSELAATPQQVIAGPKPSGVRFSEARQWLKDFDLHAEKEIAEALIDHYTAKPDFIWVSGYRPNGRAREAMRVLADAASFGLEPADYSVDPPNSAVPRDDTTARLRALIRFEMALSARVLRYVRDAHGGRIDPNMLSGYHDFAVKPIDLPATLKALSRAHDSREYLESRHPQNPEFKALRVELEALRASADDEIVVDPATFVRPGNSHAELPKLLELISRQADDDFRAEYGEVLERNLESEAYSDELVPVVKAAQERNSLKPDGIIGPRTVHALAGSSKAARIEKVVIALESLRWHPSDLGDTRVFVNQPAFTATFRKDGVDKLSMRAIVGKKSNQTSFFYDEIEQVDFNPYWGVPRSILVNEMLPRLLRDPGYLDRAGYEVTDSSGRRIPSSAINWGRYGAKIPYNVRQTPSERNALGELKILFPNKHAIYMHDTPTKNLFQQDVRAFSHGCIRLQDPRGMAAAVLQTSVEDIASKLKKGHSSEKVSQKIPVYVAYFTAWPDQSGTVEYFPDLYDRDAHLKKALETVAAARAPAS